MLGVSLGLRQLRQAEVENLGAAFLRHEDVFGFQVAVNDSLLVRGRKAVGDLDGDVDRLARCQCATSQALAQGLALQQLHDKEVSSPTFLE